LESGEPKNCLDQGGQGVTYVVHRIGDLDKFVLKKLKNQKRLDRFKLEIEALRKLNHPNIIKVIDYELRSADKATSCYYVSEYCPKGDLSKVDLAGMALLDKLRLFRQVCEAMAAAHRKNLMHRDLKPANILMRSDGSVVVADFGLCLDLSQLEERQTRTSEAVGPRLYMAPELEAGRDENPQPSSDCYSLGKLLYYIMSGRGLPRERHREQKYSLLKPECDQGLHFVYELFDKSIQEDPASRFQTAKEFLMELDGVMDGIERSAHVLDLNVKQHCLYCRSGFYQKQLLTGPSHRNDTKSDAFRFWGTNHMGERDMMALVCNTCGNVQLFRLDLVPH
jgi:serine/threonine protein kinase